MGCGASVVLPPDATTAAEMQQEQQQQQATAQQTTTAVSDDDEASARSQRHELREAGRAASATPIVYSDFAASFIASRQNSSGGLSKRSVWDTADKDDEAASCFETAPTSAASQAFG